MKTQIAISHELNSALACAELKQQLGETMGAVLFFCSSAYQLDVLGTAMQKTFEGVTVVGCTSAGEVSPNGYESQCIVAIGLCHQYFSVSANLIEEISAFTLVEAQNTVSELHQAIDPYFETEQGFLLTLIDGLSASEEAFLVKLNSAAVGLPHLGGSAGDDNQLAMTHVYYRGGFYRNAAVVILVKSKLPFEVFSLFEVQSSKQKLVVTEADPASRTAYEIDGQPAAEAYAEALGLRVSDLNQQVFAKNPLAVKVGEDYFVRSVQRVNADMSLSFYCAINRGIVMTCVELQDSVERAQVELDKIQERLGEPEFVLALDCILNRINALQQQKLDATEALFEKFQFAGFNTYGEHSDGIHLNQTLTGVYFAR